MSTPTSVQPNVAAPAPAELTLRMGVMVVLTGLGAGLSGGLLMRLLRLVQHLSFAYSSGDFLTGVRHAPPHRRVLVLILAGLFAAISLFFYRRFTGKQTTEITGAIWRCQGSFAANPTFFKSILSIVVVGMGAAIGRETALKDAGAIIALKLSGWSRLTPEQRQLLVACGAGAGMAAAYNVPMGGALFAVEVLLGTISLPNVLAALAASFVAVATSWLLLPNAPTFQVQTVNFTPSMLLWAALAGPAFGFASAFYVKLIRWAQSGKPQGWLAIATPVVVFTALGLVSIRFPEVLGNGKNVVQEAFASQLGVPLLLWLLVLRPLATAFCLKSGAPGGLFTPTMTFGALLGGLFGEAWSHLAPATGKDSYAIVGAGAMLASASHGPISSIVFMLELTNHTDTLIVPLMIPVAGATLTARLLEKDSIYSARV
jgi:CIC family chloride channel protein